MKSNKKSGKKSNTLFITSLVILFIIVMLIFFLVNKDKIFTNLKETDFFGRVFGSTPELIEKHEIKPEKNTIPLKDDLVINVEDQENDFIYDNKEETSSNKKEELKNTEIVEKDNTKVDSSTENVTDKVEKENNKTEDKNNVKKPAITGTTQLELCFVLINGDGTVVRKPVKRTVPKDDSPLTTAINLLLEGPDKGNKAESKYMTLIPEGSKLLGARVSDGIAYLNFNDSFEFNQFGVEGAIHQLEQVVYTATSFSTVEKVQFLIEGKKREYLGSEGQWIGSPLSRADF